MNNEHTADYAEMSDAIRIANAYAAREKILPTPLRWKWCVESQNSRFVVIPLHITQADLTAVVYIAVTPSSKG